MKNIREKFREFIEDGGHGRIEVRPAMAGAWFADEPEFFKASHVPMPGAWFADEEEFIPFRDLGYNAELGFYKLSEFPDEQSECDPSNPETIHPYKAPDGWRAYVWIDESGIPHMLGERHQVADLYLALHDFLFHGIFEEDDPVSDDDPIWGGPYSIDQAAERAHAFDPEKFPEKWLTQRIRQACLGYRIEGVWKTPSGRWRIPQIEFEHWLNDASAHRSGPRTKNNE